MKNFIKLFGIIACIAAIGFSVTACGGSSLVGRWELDKNGTYPRDSVEKIEFLSDGTGSMDGMKIEWKAEKGRVMISAFGQAQTQNYKISGSKVIFCDDDGGNEAYYNRVKK